MVIAFVPTEQLCTVSSTQLNTIDATM